jgi:hypothetical protein
VIDMAKIVRALRAALTIRRDCGGKGAYWNIYHRL